MLTAFVDDSDARRFPAARFLHLLGSSLSGAPLDEFGLNFAAVTRPLQSKPKTTGA
jgi:hypothetical protein